MLLNAFRRLFSNSPNRKARRASGLPRLELLSLEQRIVPAAPFSPAFPTAISITTDTGSSGASATTSANFMVLFSNSVTGVDAVDFNLIPTGTVANGTIASVIGSTTYNFGDTYTVNVIGITGTGTLGLNLVDNPSISAIASFGGKTDFATENGPLSVKLGDVNGDGILDMVTANRVSNSASVLLGNGNGTFGGQTSFATGSAPDSVTLGDVNGDGKLDIVTTNGNTDDASVLLGNGNGTFQTQISTTAFAMGSALRSVTLGDVNGDGKLDIITANFGTDSAGVLLGNGNGTFLNPTTFTTGIGSTPFSVTLGDVNRDGILDIVTANQGNSSASVLLGNGNGTFGGQTSFVTGTVPCSVTLGDVNGDGKLDILTANAGDATASVLLGNGNGTFGGQTPFTTDTQPISVTLGDVNGDGKLDIITANYGSNSASILLGIGDGTFATQANFTTGTKPYSVTLGDVNGDGALDIVTANRNSNNATILLNTATSTNSVNFAPQATFTTGFRPISVKLGDLNGDGILDMVNANSAFSNTVSVILGLGNGTFGTAVNYTTGTGSGPVSVTLGDVNGDGKLDIITANFVSSKASVLLGMGNGTFGPQETFATGTDPKSVTLGDVKADGKLDIVTVNYNSNNASVLLGTGNGTFGTKTDFATGTNPNSVTLGDVNGDGKLDIVATNYSSNSASVLLGTGNGTFGPKTDFATSAQPKSVTLGDVNGDGKLDILTANAGDATASVLLGNGNGTFGGQVTFATGSDPNSVTLGDVNADGKLDIITTNYFSNDVSVLLNSIAFTGQTYAIGISSPTVISISPTTGSVAGGTAITITGTNLTGATAVTIDGVAATNIIVVSPTSITATTPAGTAGANKSVLVTTPGGTNTANTLFTYTAAPTPPAPTPTPPAPSPTPTPTAPLITGTPPPPSSGGSSTVNLYNTATGEPTGTAVPFPGFKGPVKVVSGDFNGDGVADLVAGAGFGGGPAIAILNSQTGEVMETFFAFDPSFTGGVFVAVEDINGDGILDIIAGAGAGGGPEVRIFDGRSLNVLRSFYAYAQDFTGGVSVATIDFNNDGILDLVTGAGPGGAPHVKVYDGATNAIISQWYAYPASFTGGVFVAVGDIGNDGTFEVVTGAGQGGAPVVAVWDPFTGALLAQFMAYAEDFTGGVRVAVNDGNGDGVPDIITGAGPGGGPHVNVFNFPALDLLFSFYSGEPTNTGGVFVS